MLSLAAEAWKMQRGSRIDERKRKKILTSSVIFSACENFEEEKLKKKNLIVYVNRSAYENLEMKE